MTQNPAPEPPLSIGSDVETYHRTAADLIVSEAAAERVRQGRAEATTSAYESHWGRYVKWCAEEGRTPLPCTAHTFLEYANHLMTRDLAASTIVGATTAIRDRHRRAGYPAPEMDAVRLALVSYGRARAATGRRRKRAAALTIEDLGVMIEACDRTTVAGVRDRALLVLGWAMMGRRSEIAALDIADIHSDPNGLIVYVAFSKTDQSGEGVEVPIPYWARAEACPVRLVQAWIDLLASRGHTTGPLFRRVDRHGRLSGEPGFAGRNGDTPRIAGQAVDVILKRRACEADLPALPELSAHSLRAGGATGARLLGGDTLEITRIGRWIDGSKSALGYFRSVDRWRNHPMAGVKL